MMIIVMFDLVGDFGEDKDRAAIIRKEKIVPCLDQGNTIILDFSGVRLVTQSFIHALISDALRRNGEKALDLLNFSNCVDNVQGIISTVVQYTLDSVENPIEI